MSGGLRKRPNRPYEVRVPSTTVRDTRLSYRALGVLTWILDQADGWDVRSEQMATMGRSTDGTGPGGAPHRREGRDAIRAALRELAEVGHYRLERRRMRDGTVTMGTAASEVPVASWAEQSALFAGRPVPVVEQPDGSFWVRYPDGTVQPDDWPAPEPQPDPAPSGGLDLAAELADPDDLDVSAGGTGDGFSGPGPGPDSPAPVKPAPGAPAPGKPAPLVVTSSGFHKVAASPPPPTPQGGPEEVAADQAVEEDPLVAEVLTAASHWSRARLEEVLTDPDMTDRRRRDPAAFAAAVLAVARGDYGHTASPRRLSTDGPWWADAHGVNRAPRQRDPEPAMLASDAVRACRRCGLNGWVEHPETREPLYRCDHIDPEQVAA